jgi:hypothetical protein
MNALLSVVRRLHGSVGLLLLVAGFAVVGESFVQFLLAKNVARQMDFAVSGAAVGLGFVVIGGVVLVTEHGMADVLDEVDGNRLLAGRLRAIAGASGAPVAGPAGAQLTAVPSVVQCSQYSYHRADCMLIEGRADLVELPYDEARGSARTPCDLCLRGL